MNLRLLILSAFLAGCATGNYARSVHGTVGGYSLANARPEPIGLMVTRQIERPLYIVLDDARVKDTWPIDTAACQTGGMGCEHFNVMSMQTFVTRDLKNAMGTYFSRVEVVRSPKELPTTPHVVADVKIDDVRLNSLVRGMLTYNIIEMHWGFAMRKSEQADYAYTYAGEATSNDSYPTFEAGLAQLVENAIPSMLKKWTEEHGMEALRDDKK